MPVQNHTSELALVFLHLPKTGGTTLHHHFSAHFTPEEICPERHSNLNAYSVDALRQWRFFSGHFNADEIRRIPRPLFVVTVFRDPIERLLSLYDFWKRHSDEYIEMSGDEGLRITKAGTLMDFLQVDYPLIVKETLNSMVTQSAGAVLVTPDGYALMSGQQQIGWLSEAQLVSRALNNILSFDVVGEISRLAEVYGKVAEKFGMQPLTEVARLNTKEDERELMDPYTPEPITPEIGSLLEEKTRLDRMLYELLRDHFQRDIHRLDPGEGRNKDFIPLALEPGKQPVSEWYASFGL